MLSIYTKYAGNIEHIACQQYKFDSIISFAEKDKWQNFFNNESLRNK